MQRNRLLGLHCENGRVTTYNRNDLAAALLPLSDWRAVREVLLNASFLTAHYFGEDGQPHSIGLKEALVWYYQGCIVNLCHAELSDGLGALKRVEVKFGFGTIIVDDRE